MLQLQRMPRHTTMISLVKTRYMVIKKTRVLLRAMATEPSATEPAAAEPSTTEPAATEPAASEPAAAEPAAAEPAATTVEKCKVKDKDLRLQSRQKNN